MREPIRNSSHMINVIQSKVMMLVVLAIIKVMEIKKKKRKTGWITRLIRRQVAEGCVHLVSNTNLLNKVWNPDQQILARKNMHNNTVEGFCCSDIQEVPWEQKIKLQMPAWSQNLCYFVEQPNQPKPPWSKSSYRWQPKFFKCGIFSI